MAEPVVRVVLNEELMDRISDLSQYNGLSVSSTIRMLVTRALRAMDADEQASLSYPPPNPEVVEQLQALQQQLQAIHQFQLQQSPRTLKSRWG